MKRLVLVLAILFATACTARGPLGGTFSYTPPGWVTEIPIVGPAVNVPVEPAPAPAPAAPVAAPVAPAPAVQPAPGPVPPPAIVK